MVQINAGITGVTIAKQSTATPAWNNAVMLATIATGTYTIGTFDEGATVSIAPLAANCNYFFPQLGFIHSYEMPDNQLFPIGLTMNRTTGSLAGIVQPMRPWPVPGGNYCTYYFQMVCQNRAGTVVTNSGTDWRNFRIVVKQNTNLGTAVFPAWQTAAGYIGTFTEGQAFSTSVIASHPTNAITYSVQASSLYPTNVNATSKVTMSGVTVNASGVISGTPTVSHSLNAAYLIRATTSVGFFKERNFNVVINDVRKPPTFLTPAGNVATIWRNNFRNETIRIFAYGENEFSKPVLSFSGSLPPYVSWVTETPGYYDAKYNWTVIPFGVGVGMVHTQNNSLAAGTYNFSFRAYYSDLGPTQLYTDRSFNLVLTQNP